VSISTQEVDNITRVICMEEPTEQDKSLVVSKKINKGDKYIPEEYLKKLYDLVDNVRDKTYIMYHSQTGLRVSDVVHSEVVHIDWDSCKTYTYDFKKDKWRWVYFPEFVKSQLKMWFKQRQVEDIKDKRIFPFSEKTANRILKRWCKKIDFPYSDVVGSHWLRHTFIRLSRKAGRDIKAVQQNTGDTVKTILEWYSDLSSEDMKEEIREKPLIRG